MRLLALLAAFALAIPVFAQDLVAKTDALSPADELKKFKLPEGFTAQLVVSEPDIQKPMQLAFDTKGRLWVTTSHHYPWAAEGGKGTDKLFVLSDFDDAGKAKKVTVFDDKLNIPIGVLPLPDCKSVIVSECGKILKLTDTDDDGKADKREVLFEGFGFKDTHGMTNSFTLLPDGWVYACHGFANDCKVKGKDGHEITMNSGHTFRFKPDGSRIEVFTRGQVNPFGMCVDPWLNLYTADCHSKPMTQLIRGAYYDSFGKPHDGLGYAPHLFNHQHGSTGLCGLVYYAADHFPKEWNGVMFVGNCVTNRINCDRIEWKGSTPVGKELPDFLSSDDPWFRPVDLKIGPDGAMYVSDFYNKIIGHYEVDLKDPRRDKDRGRIWRIVYTGKKGETTPPPDLSSITPLRELAAARELTADQRGQTVVALQKGARVARAAVDVMTAHPHESFIDPLLAFAKTIPADDTHMKHAAKVALRNCLEAVTGRGEAVTNLAESATDADAVLPFVQALRGCRTPLAATALAKLLSRSRIREVDAFEVGLRVGLYGDDAACGELQALNSTPTAETLKGLAGMFRGLRESGYKAKPLKDNADRGVLGAVDTALKLAASALGGSKPEHHIAALDLYREVRKTLPPDWVQHPLITRWLSLQLLTDSAASPGQQLAAAEVALLYGQKTSRRAVHDIIESTSPNSPTRSTLIPLLLADAPTTGDCGLAVAELRTAPYTQAVAYATGLAGDKFGADLLLANIGKGEAPARLLQEKVVVDRLKATKVKDLDAKLADLTKNIPPAEKRVEDLLKARATGFPKAKTDVAKGKAVFTKNCAVCHQLNNEGAKVGPQLDGIGIRGPARLMEDTLDPSRHVDAAFRATKLELKDGSTLSGLVREDGAVYVLVDGTGKEHRVPTADVDKKTTTSQSAMPANLDTVMKEDEYYNLLAFLLEQKPKR